MVERDIPPAADGTPAGGTGPPRGAPPRTLPGPTPGAPSDDPAWRADALARSSHSRAADQARPPSADFDAGRAAELCAEVCRAALADFAPALGLLPRPERERAQALAACAYTLFDFARQGGVEGERLAEINRWEYTLEAALAGAPVGQPVFVRLVLADRVATLPAMALDGLLAAARRRAVAPRPRTPEEAAARAEALAAALAHALLGQAPMPAVIALAHAVLRVALSTRLPDELRARRCHLAVSELPEPLADATPAAIASALRAELARLRALLAGGEAAVAEAPVAWRPAAAYLLLAARRLVAALERTAGGTLARPARLGAWARLLLLYRARRLAARAARPRSG